MKKIISLVLALGMVLSLAACGGGSKPSDGPVEVVFWHSLSGPVGDELQKIVDEYNAGRGAEQGVTVTAVYQGYEGTDKQILAYQTKDTKNACDINVGLTSTIPSMLQLDWTVKVDDLYEKYGSYVDKSDFPEALVESASSEGQMIAMPFLNSTMLFFANMDMLKAAGINEVPATMDELVAATSALTEKDASGTVTRYGFECGIKRYQLVNYICAQSTDAYFYDNNGGRNGIATKVIAGEEGTLKNFLEKVDALVKTGGYQYVEGNIREEFANETTAMAMMSSSRVTNLEELIGDKFEWVSAPIPAVNAGDTGSAGVGGSCLVVFNRGDENRVKGAWDFVQYLCTADSQYRIATNSGYVPTNKAVADLDTMKDFWNKHPQAKTAFDVVMNAAVNAQEPMEPSYNEIDGVITDTMRSFCDGNLTVDQAVSEIESKCNQLLDEWHEANG